jgi:hypothetical protein
MKILSTVLAMTLALTALTTSASASSLSDFFLHDDKIWTQAEIDALVDATVYRDKVFPPGVIGGLGAPKYGVPSRISLFDSGEVVGYIVTDGTRNQWYLVPTGEGTFKSLDFDAPPPRPENEDAVLTGPDGSTITIPWEEITVVGPGGINISPTPSSSLVVTAVPEPGTIGLLLGGAGALALIVRRRR